MLATESDKRQLLLDPDGEADPAIQMINNETESGSTNVRNSVGEDVCWTTDAPLGYVFKKIDTGGNDDVAQVAVKSPKSVAAEMLLMLITSRHGRPAVGIGTDHPQGMLDVKEEGKGQILIQPGEKKDPEVILVNLDEKCDKNYLALSVGESLFCAHNRCRARFSF